MADLSDPVPLPGEAITPAEEGSTARAGMPSPVLPVASVCATTGRWQCPQTLGRLGTWS